jgi:drug/metabolite transporter (DMT)-like permease
MLRVIALLVLTFAGAFAYSVGSHLASESRALIAGIVIGVVASVPAALTTALLTRRGEGAQAQTPGTRSASRSSLPVPSVIILNPGQSTRAARLAAPYLDALQEPQKPRSFTVIGDE